MTIPAIYSELKAAYRRPTLDMFKEGAITPKEAYVKKGAITLEGVGGEEILLEKADVVIMNPPFTRQERLPLQYKESLNLRLKEYSEKLHGQLGLHGYFIFLADKFLKPNGRLALVLPATVLRLRSTQKIRDMLLDDYIVDYIITTYQRAAFSEGAQFREILLVARKRPKEIGVTEIDSDQCAIITLKKLPTDLTQAREFADRFKEYRKRPIKKNEGDYFSAIVVTQDELKKNADNLFRLVATTKPDLVKSWSALKEKSQMTKLSNYLESDGRIIRGFEMTLREASPASAYTTVLIRDVARAMKKHDQWVVANIDGKQVLAENRFTHITTQIPRTALIYALRRLSGVKTLDVSETLDLMVVKPFEGCDLLLGRKVNIKNSLRLWSHYAKSRKTNLVFIRRFDLSAPGTILFSHYSPKDFAASKMMYCFKDISESNAKILTLWFNSTLNVLQLFLDRTETRGAFIGFSKYALLDTYVLNPLELNKEQKDSFLHLYDKIKETEFPSLLEQLKEKFPARVEIDKLVLWILGFSEKDTHQLIDNLYPALANEIEQLKTLMAG